MGHMQIIPHSEGRGKGQWVLLLYLGMEKLLPWIIDFVMEYIREVLVAITIFNLGLFRKKILNKLCLLRHRNRKLTFSIYQGGRGKFVNTNPHSGYIINLAISNRCVPVTVVKPNVWVKKNDKGQTHKLIHRRFTGENKTISSETLKEFIEIPNSPENRALLKNSKLYVELIDTENKTYPCEKYLIPNI